jgi:translation initiation factor IF-2
MSDENQKENGLNSKEAKKEEAPKKKKLAVVFHSQNSANHKNHPLGGKLSAAKEQGARKTRTAADSKEKDQPKKTSPNGRPLPPGTARVTPLRELNEIQQRQAEEEARAEAARKAAEEEARKKAETAKDEAEEDAEDTAEGAEDIADEDLVEDTDSAEDVFDEEETSGE